ncbi:hypothetical protein EAG75_19075 [Pseudomonas protegens]|nr:hypothetical protein EAG75_19075 [Pseudomonas protegens]
MKTGSACSFRPQNSASSPAFALPDLCSASFRTDLCGGRLSPPRHPRFKHPGMSTARHSPGLR